VQTPAGDIPELAVAARVTFRLWTVEDLSLAIAIWGSREVTRLIADIGTRSEEQARECLAKEMANWEKH
jgi:hypothetical protein